ncbi:MAG TPA: hypothetical protein VGV86_15475 [Acidimicrobiales bacterium]|nr:hypothetical protein [Acidimicrobiales bacterium]
MAPEFADDRPAAPSVLALSGAVATPGGMSLESVAAPSRLPPSTLAWMAPAITKATSAVPATRPDLRTPCIRPSICSLLVLQV